MKVKTHLRAGFIGQGEPEPQATTHGAAGMALPGVPAGAMLSSAAEAVGRALRRLGASAETWGEEARRWALRQTGEAAASSPKRYWEMDIWRGGAIAFMLAYHAAKYWGPLLGVAPWAAMLPVIKALAILVATLGGGFLIALPAALAFVYGREPLAEMSRHRPVGALALVGAIVASVTMFIAWVSNFSSGAPMFIFMLGMGISLRHGRGRGRGETDRELFASHARRGAQLIALGLLITLFTLVILPQHFVAFGVLHFLGLATLLAFPLLDLPWWANAAAGLGVIGLDHWVMSHLVWSQPWGTWLGIAQAGHWSADQFALFPFFGFVLLGLAAGRLLYPDGQRAFTLPDLSQLRVVKWLSWLGRNALPIYLTQVPLTFGGMAMA